MSTPHPHQDWNVVILKSKKAIAADSKQGHYVHDEVAAKNKKLDQETEDFHHKKVPSELTKQIIKARVERKLTRDGLAKALNMPESKIADIENGKAIYNGAELAKIKRFLSL